MQTLKTKTQTLSHQYIRSLPIEILLQQKKVTAHIQHLFPSWWYTQILNDIIENELSVATPNWFLEYMLSTNIAFDKSFRNQRLATLYTFLCRQKHREFQMVGLLKNIHTDCYYNEECTYDSHDILFAVQYNESLILFMLYTPITQELQQSIYKEKSRVFDKDFQQKIWCKWFEKKQLRLVSMFLVEQFYFSTED